MRTPWTIAKVQQLKKDGKIVSYVLPKESNKPGGRKVSKHFAKRSKEKDWIGWNLLCFCQERGLVHQEEYIFHGTRKWKIDYYIEWEAQGKAIRVGIEYEGIVSDKSRHTSIKGYTGDTDKYREAAKMGITILRYTALNYRTMLTDLAELK